MRDRTYKIARWNVLLGPSLGLVGYAWRPLAASPDDSAAPLVSDQRPMRLRTRSAVAAGLLALAAAVRFWGIFWGAPTRIDLHPDEMQHVMSHALRISLADPDPHFLNYPSLLIYVIAVTNGALTRLGVVTEPWQ